MQRIKKTGEVFTPRSLIREMLSKLPNEVWFDPNKTWLEPSAGDGNFLVEVKARLLQAGHDEFHILENMLFSVELIDDNHWVLQHRLGYLVDGQPNPKFWPNGENFQIGKIHPIAQDLNNKNPYHENLGLEKDEVLHHRNHVCTTALEYDMSFGRTEDVKLNLPLLPVRDLGEWPETDTPDIGEKYVVEKMLGTQPQLAHKERKERKERKHPVVNEVTFTWENREEIPEKEKDKIQIYAILIDGKVYGVGQTKDMTDRIPNGYRWKTQSMQYDGSTVITFMQNMAVENGNKLSFSALFLEQVPEDEKMIAEGKWIEHFLAEGHPVQNRTRAVKVKEPKEPKEPKVKNHKPSDTKGGGWQIKPEWYGTGHVIRCKAPFDGSFWECDHDALYDRVNASLKAKGKTGLGEPGPSQKQYGASSGLREFDLWRRVD